MVGCPGLKIANTLLGVTDKDLIEGSPLRRDFKGRLDFNRDFQREGRELIIQEAKSQKLEALKQTLIIPGSKRVWKVTDRAWLGIRLTRQLEPTF